MQSCHGETVATVSENAVATGYRYTDKTCHDTAAVKVTIANKIWELEQWMDMEPEKQFLRKSIVLNA